MMTKQPRRYVENPKIRSMRVRSWFHAVSQASGLTVGELEREFREEGSAQAPRSCIWNKYKRGEVVPRSRYQGDVRPKLVERVEARYPGTEKWLFSPLWRLADEAPMEMSELRETYEHLPSRLRNLILLPTKLGSVVFWRREFEVEELVTQLIHFRRLDDLILGMALVREAEVCQGHIFYRYLIEVVKVLMRGVAWEGLEKTAIPFELISYLSSIWMLAKPVLSVDAQNTLDHYLKDLDSNLRAVA